MGYFEAVLNFSSPTGVIKNVVHYNLSSDDPANIQEATDIIMGQFNIICAGDFSPAVVFESITWREEIEGAVGVEYSDPSGPYPGTFSDGDYAPNAAMLVRKFHDSGVRPSRGRNYIGGVTAEALEATGRWNAVNVGRVVSWFEYIRSFTVNEGADTVDMVIKATNPTAPNTVPFSIVNRVSGEVRVKSQKRRLEGIGS